MLNNIEGAGLLGLQAQVSDGGSGVFMVNSPYDCCAACVTTEGCGVAVYFGNGNCATFTNGQCSPANPAATATFARGISSEQTVFNSNCGSFQIIDLSDG